MIFGSVRTTEGVHIEVAAVAAPQHEGDDDSVTLWHGGQPFGLSPAEAVNLGVALIQAASQRDLPPPEGSRDGD